MIDIKPLVDEARKLCDWYRQPSGYANVETNIVPKIDRAFELLTEFSSINVLKDRGEITQLHIEISHIKEQLAAKDAEIEQLRKTASNIYRINQKLCEGKPEMHLCSQQSEVKNESIISP